MTSRSDSTVDVLQECLEDQQFLRAAAMGTRSAEHKGQVQWQALTCLLRSLCAGML